VTRSVRGTSIEVARIADWASVRAGRCTTAPSPARDAAWTPVQGSRLLYPAAGLLRMMTRFTTCSRCATHARRPNRLALPASRTQSATETIRAPSIAQTATRGLIRLGCPYANARTAGHRPSPRRNTRRAHFIIAAKNRTAAPTWRVMSSHCPNFFPTRTLTAQPSPYQPWGNQVTPRDRRPGWRKGQVTAIPPACPARKLEPVAYRLLRRSL